jgi:hypothetical protein
MLKIEITGPTGSGKALAADLIAQAIQTGTVNPQTRKMVSERGVKVVTEGFIAHLKAMKPKTALQDSMEEFRRTSDLLAHSEPPIMQQPCSDAMRTILESSTIFYLAYGFWVLMIPKELGEEWANAIAFFIKSDNLAAVRLMLGQANLLR